MTCSESRGITQGHCPKLSETILPPMFHPLGSGYSAWGRAAQKPAGGYRGARVSISGRFVTWVTKARWRASWSVLARTRRATRTTRPAGSFRPSRAMHCVRLPVAEKARCPPHPWHNGQTNLLAGIVERCRPGTRRRWQNDVPPIANQP